MYYDDEQVKATVSMTFGPQCELKVKLEDASSGARSAEELISNMLKLRDH